MVEWRDSTGAAEEEAEGEEEEAPKKKDKKDKKKGKDMGSLFAALEEDAAAGKPSTGCKQNSCRNSETDGVCWEVLSACRVLSSRRTQHVPACRQQAPPRRQQRRRKRLLRRRRRRARRKT